MAGPGDEISGAGGRGRLRASHADREQVIDTLKAAFVQGMLGKDEFDLRVSRAFASRTYAELAAATADLPVKPAAAQPPKPARTGRRKPVLRPVPVAMMSTALYASMWALILLRHGPSNPGGDPPRAVALLFISANLIYPLVLIIAVALMIAGWRKKRSGQQRPRRRAPGAGDQRSRRRPSADLGGQLPLNHHGHEHTAEAAGRGFPGGCRRAASGHRVAGALAGDSRRSSPFMGPIRGLKYSPIASV
jgi:hypothetical protein